MSGVRYNSGRKRYLGPLLELELPITLDPAQYTGAIVYANDGAIYYSNGVDWVIPVDRVPIARPVALSPTTPTQQAQLRLNAYFSAIDIPQTGVFFEVSLTESFTSPLFTRELTGEGIFQYQMEYPEDGLEPGDIFYWRGRYIGGAEQSAFSIPIQQTFPELIAQPIQISPAGSIQGAVTISDYESPFDLIFVQSEIEFYDATGVTLLETITDTTFGVNQFAIPATLTEGTTYTWRARRGGKIGIDGATQFSPWTGKRAVVNGARSIVLTYDTALMSARTIGVPLAGTVDCTIDWGDGLSDAYTTAGVKTHTYDVAVTGTVTVTISGTLTTWGGQNGISAAQQQGLTRVEAIGFQMGLVSLFQALFRTSANLTFVTPNLPPTITNLSLMFQNSSSNANISDMNVSNVTNMNGMFTSSLFNRNLSNWDVSNVTNMQSMFQNNTTFNNGGSPDINNWDVSSVTNMASMFRGASSFNQPIGNWDVSNVTTMNGMLLQSGFNQNIGSWDVRNVTNFGDMFQGATQFRNGDSPSINSWDTRSATTMVNMFFAATNFNQPIGNWDVSSVTNMGSMFQSATNFNQPIGDWDVSSVTNMQQIFQSATNFNQPIGDWDVSSVTAMNLMFNSAINFNQPIGDWDVSSVTAMNQMFQSATNFNQPIGNWDVFSVTNMTSMFNGATNFNQPIGDWNLRPAGVTMTTFNIPAMNEENYSRTIAGWANNLATNDGPYNVALGLTATRLYNANNYLPTSRFTNATDARAFLVGARVIEVTGASDANANTTYTFNAGTQTYDAANDWYFAILGTSWALYDDSDVLQATGTGTAVGTGPHTATAWDGVLSAATVLRTGAVWTITGDAAA
jgi:surface protein